MNPALAAIAGLYYSAQQHLNVMLAACQTEQERSEIRLQYSRMRHNYYLCTNKPFDDGDPELAELLKEANSTGEVLRTIEQDLGDIHKVLAAMRSGSTIGTAIATSVPRTLQIAATRLKAGESGERLTVREFLAHFGVERRGALKVEAIRQSLDRLGVETEPDFEDVWIDAPIQLKLKNPNPLATYSTESPHTTTQESSAGNQGVAKCDATPEHATDSQVDGLTRPQSNESDAEETAVQAVAEDPTYRIGSLPAANKALVTVRQGEPLNKAVTLMLQHDFSQIPIMQGERQVKGVVTWKSIALKKALGYKCDLVEQCKEEPRVVDSNRTLFDAIPLIVEYGYVLVRDQRDQRITGLVAASDLSLQFQALAEPFLLLREVELHIRQLLEQKVDLSDLATLTDTSIARDPIQSVSDLSFGQYVRLFQSPAIWERLDIRIDRVVFCELLESIRIIRNDVMHFDPDPMTFDDLSTLKRAGHLMRSLYELSPS